MDVLFSLRKLGAWTETSDKCATILRLRFHRTPRPQDILQLGDASAGFGNWKRIAGDVGVGWGLMHGRGGYEGKTLLSTYLHVGPNRIAHHMSASFTNPSAPIPHPAPRWERAMHGRMERQDPSVSSLTRESHPRRVPHVSDLHTPPSRFHFAASLPARPPRIRL